MSTLILDPSLPADHSPLVSGGMRGQFQAISNIFDDIRARFIAATGLTSGTQYWFDVRAIGAAGPSAWSDPATKRAT